MMKKITFRVDGNPEIGMGHIQRCSVLAQKFKKQGANVVFVCEQSTKKYVHELRSKFKFRFIHSRNNTTLFKGFDVIVIDHLNLDSRFEQALKEQSQSMIVVIDDLAKRKHTCDILLNPNPGFYTKDYKKLVPAHCRVLLGPAYALIRSDVVQLASTQSFAFKPIRNILINFGGGDQHGMCKFALKALLRTSFDGNISVVLGHSINGLRAMREIKKQSSLRINIKGFVNMTQELRTTDLVIGSASSSVWERCMLGKPSIVISLADNQTAAAKFLSKHQAALYVGFRKNITVKVLYRKIQMLLDDSARINQYTVQSRNLVDGKGAQRLIDEMNISMENKDWLHNDYRRNFLHWDGEKRKNRDFDYSNHHGVIVTGIHLPWDTALFGKKSARINHFQSPTDNIEELKNGLKHVLNEMKKDGIEFVDTRIGIQAYALVPIFQKLGFRIVDRMNIYVSDKPTSKTIKFNRYKISNQRPTRSQFLQMKKFGMKSFIHSRIYNDKNIPKHLADRFYEKLLESAWKNRSATFVLTLDKTKVIGFCIGTVDHIGNKNHVGILSMIAVDPKYAGRGIGSTLLDSFLHIMHKKYDVVEIGTQFNNKAANALYRSFGLPVKSQLITMHHHFKSSASRKYTIEDIEKEYDSSSQEKHEYQKVKWASKGKMINRFRRAIQELPFQNASTWLDVGSGTGSFQSLVKKKYSHIQATGIDISGKLIKHAKKKNSKLHVHYKKTDFLQFASGKYDLITSIGVLQKTNMDIDAFFKKAFQLLNPDGKLFIDTKHATWEMFKNSKLVPDQDISWFDTQKLIRAAKNAKFKNIELHGFLPESNTVVKPEKSHTIFLTGTKGRS